MSKTCDGSQVHCTTHCSLWADLGMIKPGQIVETAIQIDHLKMLPDNEPDDDKSIPSAESVFSCVEKQDNFLFPCIVSEEAM